MNFELSPTQVKKYNRWKKKLPKISDDYFGLIGGGYWFKFTPTGIGMVIVAGRYDVPHLNIELTEYENF